jgi:hypothetical protein
VKRVKKMRRARRIMRWLKSRVVVVRREKKKKKEPISKKKPTEEQPIPERRCTKRICQTELFPCGKRFFF